MLTDYHVHLRPDEIECTADKYFTVGNVERYLEAAEAAGVSELGVSEHIHRFEQALDIWQHPFWKRNATDDIYAYVEFVRTETPLKLGIEMDFVPGREERIRDLVDGVAWDYVVGSVHFLADSSLDIDEFDVWNTGESPEKIWSRYFETIAESARSGLFDIIAHPDLVKYWGNDRPVPDGDLRFFYEPAVAAFAETGVAVEISTAGLRKPAGEIYPAPDYLEMCAEAGCTFALSSDAHEPNHIGYEYDYAVDVLRGFGVAEIALFDNRERRVEALG